MQYHAATLGTPTAQVIGLEPWQYGVLGVACALLIYAVIHLYRDGRKRERQIAASRRAWDEERVKLLEGTKVELEAMRATYEEKHREIVEHFAQELRDDRKAFDERLINATDAARRDFAELMEKVADKNAQVLQATANVMEKFYGRFVGPRGRY